MPNRNKSILITDLDNTLFDWVHLWHECFVAMLDSIVETSGLPEDALKKEIKKIHERHGTSEYSFLIEELPSLRAKFPDQPLIDVFAPAIRAYRAKRKVSLVLYPKVAESLLLIKGAGTKIVGYTESMAFYSNYRVRKLGLDGVFDFIFSPKDHDIPAGIATADIRKYPASHYEFKYTQHRHTPAGELKPNKDILLSIIRETGGSPDEAVYVGDSLMKDVAMALQAGVSDVWAKYGLVQDTKEYELLRQVTHWSDEQVEKEKKIAQPDVKPTTVLENHFSELLDHFKFGNGHSHVALRLPSVLSNDEKKNLIDVWKTVVDVQKHFNDISMRIRGVFITLIVALSAALGFLLEKGLSIEVSSTKVLYATFIPMIGIVATFLFYFIDRYWYHRLLIGSVNQGLMIEKAQRFSMPELGLTRAIGDASPVKQLTGITKWVANRLVSDKDYREGKGLHSTGKIEIFYKSVFVMFVAIFIVLILSKGVLLGDRSLLTSLISQTTVSTNEAKVPQQNPQNSLEKNALDKLEKKAKEKAKEKDGALP